MRRIIYALGFAALLLACAPAAQAQISFNFRVGTPPPAPRAYRVPPQPGPDYEWVEGYWYPENGRYVWHNGYWSRPPYPGAYWVAPYYDRGEYYSGHWDGRQGEVHHDHRWDNANERDQRWNSPEGDGRSVDRGGGRSFDQGGGPRSFNQGRGEMTQEQAQAVVRSAYENVLGREPDPGSSGYVDRVLRDHWSQQQIENELRNSAEYRQKHQGR